MFSLQSLSVRSNLQLTFSKLQELNERGHQTYSVARETAVAMATKVETNVQSSMDNIMHQISSELYMCLCNGGIIIYSCCRRI